METQCRNCNNTLPGSAKYCPSCGQKNTTGRIYIWTLINDFLSNQFDLNGKLLKSLRDLFIPGKLSLEYFKGRHKSYIHPIQLFFVLGVLMFGSITLKYGDNLDNNNGLNVNGVDSNNLEIEYAKDNLLEHLDSIKKDLNLFYSDDKTTRALDSLSKALHAEVKVNNNDSLPLFILIGDYPKAADGSPISSMSIKDFATLSDEQLLDKYNIQGIWQRLQFRQMVKVLKDGKGYTNFLVGQSIWALMLTIPILALFMKLLYLRQKRYYVEHLIFGFHFHAFLFIITGLIVLIGEVISEFLLGLLIFFIFAYLFLAMKKFYQQNYFKTFVKYIAVLLAYSFATIIGLVVVALISIFIF